MKKILCACAIALATCGTAGACGYDYDDFETYGTWFFSSFEDDYSFFSTQKYKGNIEDWTKYLGISYEDAEYLVLKVGKNEIEAAINGYLADPKLKFMNADFVKKNRRALQYLVCAKTIEPYATRDYNPYWEWGYYWNDEGPAISELGEEFVETLIQACETETDKELKLRYGYQLVRYAHYLHRYSDAVAYFDKYVEPLKIKNEVYYYALSQKAGAEYNLSKYSQAVKNFVSVYVNSTDLKEKAYQSIFSYCDGYFLPFSLVQMCETQEQKFDMYLLLAYNSFADPLQMARKITDIDPNASQARKLIMKQIRQLEDHYHSEVWSSLITIESVNDFHLTGNDKIYNSTIEYLEQMIGRASDPDFWNMTLGYVHFLNSDYDKAKLALDKVSAKTKSENPDIKNVYQYIDICQLKTITKETETEFFNSHKDVLMQYPVCDYLRKVLANRYFVAEDYVKAFLVANSAYNVTEYFPTDMVESIIELSQKKDKTPMEKWMTDFEPATIVRLQKTAMNGAIASEDIAKAIDLKNKYSINDKVPFEMFGHNIYNVYGLDYGIYNDYVADVIGNSKNVSVTATLEKLMQLARGEDAAAAKANYVLGNFYYNVSHMGMCRNYLKGIDTPDYYNSEYDNYMNTGELEISTFDKNKAKQEEYFPVVRGTYANTATIAEKYFKRAETFQIGDEFAAHVVFGLIKCDQAKHQENGTWYSSMYASPLFERLAKDYASTQYADEVRTNCVYYYYYSYFTPEEEQGDY